jgi:hypothetical protein
MSTRRRLSTTGQLRALVRLRWQMIRSRPIRWAISGAIGLPIALVFLGLVGVQSAPEDQQLNLALATPTFYVGFLLLALIAPLVSGGGYELYPTGQLVSFPVRPSTVFRGTLLLAPANLAWLLNAVALFVVTGFASGPISWAPTARSLVVVAAFIALATVFGQTLGWLVLGIRQSRVGRIATNLTGVVAVLAVLYIFWADQVVPLLDQSPTRYVLVGALDGHSGQYRDWLTVVAILVAATLVLVKTGDAVAAWALRRPGDHADRTASRALPRRRQHASPLLALVAIDHASIWRSTPLRRGVLVLVFIPGAVAALAGMRWQSLVLVPGLIASGAGLLFGINAFTLDSTGSVWLSTLPRWPRPAFLAKSLVFLEVALAAVASALVGGSLRAGPPASAAEVTAAVLSAVSCAVIVVALGMRSSLRHPHRADLSGPRETPATPAVMAAQSVRFAIVTTLVSMLFLAMAATGVWWLPLLSSVPVLCLATLHWYRTGLAWSHPHVRAHVVTTVSGG